ncbi:MAG: PIN domain-containing protein [Sediminibacterium sp.]|nr:PIN domain-containing protein [Sediminibacterium sp.]
MPLYFLIDTNIWVNELAGTEDDSLIKWLEYLVRNDRIRLLVPGMLMKEWKKQSAIKLKISQDKFNETGKVARQSEGVVSSLDDFMDRMRTKEKRITAMLEKRGTIVESEEVGKETIRRFSSEIAPFHNNTKSNADSLIYFSSVEYIQNNTLPGFVLLTLNSNDFGAPDSPKLNLHPDLIVEGLDIQYFNNLEGCRHAFRSKPGFEEPVTPTAPASPATGVVTILPQKRAGMLEYLYLIMQEIRTQMGFVPCHLLARMTPFKIIDNKKQSYAYYSNYTLHTNNSQLLDFFESISFRTSPRFKKNTEYENTLQNLERLAFVVKQLNHNLVFHISEQTSSRTIDIRPGRKELHCNCMMCSYERMELVNVLERLKHPENENPFDAAFVAALLECNEIACSITIGLVESALREKKMLLYYRLLFHIRWLEQLTYTHQGIVDHARLREWKEVDTDQVFAELMAKGGFWKDCADYFYNQYFEGDLVKDLYEVVHEIREHHSMQLRGGSSNNSNLYNLSARFNEFELFLKGNRMPFFRFSNFSKAFDQYTESIFVSLSLNEYQSSRVEKFNDLIIRQLFHYGSPDIITKLCNRYSRNGIAYHADDAARPVTVMIRNFLRDLPLILALPEDKLPEKSNFRNLFDRCRTLLVLLSVVKFDKQFIRECAGMIYGYLEDRKEKNLGPANELSSFLSTRLRLLDKKEQKKWLLLCIGAKSYQESELLYSFTEENLKGNRLLTTASDFALLKEHLFPKFLKPGSHYSGPVTNLYNTMGEANQKKMRVVVENRLTTEIDFPLFYSSAIQKVIDPEKWLDQYAAHFASMQKTTKRDRVFFLEGDVYLRPLNELVNLYFSLDKDLPLAVVLHYKGSSPYYDWLLDMKNFDYRKFKPIWVSLYTTRYYLKTIFSIPQVRKAVRDWLKTNTHEMIAKYYALYVE